MRDATEFQLLVEHGAAWSRALGAFLSQLHGWLRWAGAAFEAGAFRTGR